MNRIVMKTVMRRDILKHGFSIIAIGLLAACGAPAAPTSAPAATQAPAATAVPAGTTQAAPIAGANVFQIDPANTKATFTLDEKLMGSPNTVVGATSMVSGAVSANLDDMANTKIGAIQIDATSFKTDSDMRNGAIQRFILGSSQSKYQYITFEPTAIDGLKGPVTAGTTIPVKITGNLKIKDTVKPVTFDGTVTLKSPTQIEGNLKATVMRADFGLTIPSLPNVADVTDAVKLELTFIANKS